jgi:hypothetical protein
MLLVIVLEIHDLGTVACPMYLTPIITTLALVVLYAIVTTSGEGVD